jgi:hypothetical protein
MNKIISFTIILSITFSLSCKKYEDGPAFSLRTKQARLINKWKLTDTQKYIEKSQPVDNPDTTYPSISANYIEFEKHNVYSTPKDTGQWKFYDDKTKIIITLNQNNDTFKILKLRNKELWLQANTDTGKIEQHYIPFE